MTFNLGTYSEASPLLQQTRETNDIFSRWRLRVEKPRQIVVTLAIVILILACGGALMVVPQTRILEDILCHQFYGDVAGLGGEIDENLCKNDSIQSKLAYLNGILTTMEAVVGLLVAFPFGILADKVGRKKVFLTAMLGVALWFCSTLLVFRFWRVIPLQLIIFCPLFQIVGGGTPVLVAMLFSMIADVESDADRASAFFLMTLGSFTGNMFGPIIAGELMENVSAWAPFWLALVLLVLGTAIFVLVPETLHAKRIINVEIPEEGSKGFLLGIKSIVVHTFEQLMESFAMLKSVPLTIILLTCVLHTPLYYAKSTFFLQYFSKRFEWTLAKTGYLLSARGIVSVFVLLGALPLITKLLLSPASLFRFSAARKDLVLAQWSFLLLGSGMILLGGPSIAIVFGGIIVATLGDGLGPLTRSLVTAFIDPQHISRIYTLIGVMETAGTFAAGPVLAALFTRGMEKKGLWLGLPYFFLSLLCALAALSLCFVSLKTAKSGPSEELLVEEGETPTAYRDENETV